MRSIAVFALAVACIIGGPAFGADEAKKRTVVDDDVELAYREAGDRSDPTLLLLHGLTDSTHDWSLMMERLSKRFHVLALDQRGHGESAAPKYGYTVPRFAADAIEFLDAMGIERAHVAGFSMGTFVAQHMAILAPDRVSKLVLIATANTAQGNPGLAWTWEKIQGFDQGVPDDFLDTWDDTVTAVPDAFVSKMKTIQKNTPLHVWRGATKMLMEHDHSPFLGKVDHPTLILWGTEDAFFSKDDQKNLLDLLPNARLNTYNGTGHNIPWEEPQRAAKDMVEFLSD